MEAAVVSATQGALRILLGKLGDVLSTRYKLLGGVRDEIQELKDELESMTACLRDLNSSDDDKRSDQMRIWMKQVREVAYDAEDSIDVFCNQLESSRSGESRGGLARHIHKMVGVLRTLKLRNKLATEIQSLKSRTQKVGDRRLRYKMDAAPEGGSTSSPNGVTHLSSSSYADVDRRLPALHGDASRLVAMDGKTKQIADFLDEAGVARLRVISIVGFGGLGKTCLARTVYDSSLVRGIQNRAFVPVSQTYDLRSLLESVLRQLVPRPMGEDGTGTKKEEDPLHGIESLGVSQLIDKSIDYLKDKRYVIILDDVWRSEAWENLKIAFPDNGKGSRIVVTTRSHQVARNCCSSSNDRIYEMKPLSKMDSEILLFKTVFESEKCPSEYDHLKSVCEAIVGKCGGLPLAIVSIGGMLAQRQNKTEADWRRVSDSLGSEMQTDPTLEGMRRILSLSYNDLPYHLKSCFLYLSVFPEDYEIRRGALVRRWAAEGFISALHGLSLEEVAQGCFDGFISRSIVIPVQLASSGEIRSLKVHDIMLEVITSKSVQENFISFLGHNNQHNNTARHHHDKIRRLSIQPGNGIRDRDFSSRSLPHVRSLTVLGGSTERPAAITFSDLKLLRVLDLERCRWLSDGDLKDICRLSLLRYLSLRGTAVSRVPDMVGKLKGLMTLDLRETLVRDLPRSITQLQNLNHLMAGEYVHYTRTHSVKQFAFYDNRAVTAPPGGLGAMKALQRISFLNVGGSPHALRELGELSQLTRLCVLQTDRSSSWEHFGDSLSKLSSSLRYLSVMQNGFDSSQIAPLHFLESLCSPPLFLQRLHLVGNLSALPPWIPSLVNLASLSLRQSYLGAQSQMVQVLGKLPSLVSLKLFYGSYTGSGLLFEKDQFPRLKQFVVDYLATLHEIRFQGGAPRLERLSLALGSGKRVSGIESLLILKEVELYGENILDPVVEEVREMARNNTNHPTVTREDRPKEY
ncbi:hypothetical protein BS78_K011900 [Paspalum vaginatum]|uniref:Uncharacterized protein n=1 Tax=Paspalum vaginatum TaxID=158149 RepID=A0A9W7XDA4_9POAL|nr:hypothetical protein BS78_K011900 [Paspalum vaginatum]